jgi:predicted DCC family thiol-disulfide oxidoreductase YuxK
MLIKWKKEILRMQEEIELVEGTRDLKQAVVLFDAECIVCKNLAGFVARRSTGDRFIAWQEFVASAEGQSILSSQQLSQHADRLRVWTGKQLLEKEDAWLFLMERNRDLAGLNWLASQIGLSVTLARSMEKAGSMVRRLCWRCPKY